MTLTSFSQTAQEYSNKGSEKAKLQDYQGAIADYNKAIEINPKFAEAYSRRGNAKLKLQDHRGAMADYNKAAEVDPKYAKAYYNRGLLRISLDQKESGCMDLSKAGELGYEGAYESIKIYCQTSNGNNGNEQPWQNIDNNNYSISYPATWTNKGSIMGSKFTLFPINPVHSDWSENINLSIEDISNFNLNLSSYVSLSLANMQKAITNFNQIESKTEIGKSGNYQKIVTIGNQGILHLKWVQYIWVVKGKGYVLTFTSQVNDYNSLVGVATKIMNTFTIKN